MWVAGKLSGADGPSGMDAMAFQSWLLRFVQASAIIKEEITAWPDWISNESPPCKAYHAIMSVRLVSLEKSQGVRTVEIREVCRRLFAKLFLQSGGAVGEGVRECESLCRPRVWHRGSHTHGQRTGGAFQRGDSNRTEGAPRVGGENLPKRVPVA